MSYWKVILATLVIFCSGIVTGSLLTKRPQHRLSNPTSQNSSLPMHLQRGEFLRKLDKQLNLTTNQHERIEKIIKESQERTKPLYEKINPEVREELKLVREQIRAELDPKQKQKYTEILKPKVRRPDEPTPEDRRRKTVKESGRDPLTNNVEKP